ncbi:MAG TPA: cytochrome oxidase assembly protein [Chloroflexi bacterium]|nr:cytochrome oxidase assembly protein [Chloroflexota bacterium]HHW87051.1 heme A synthase [Chloroflexota bacterium]
MVINRRYAQYAWGVVVVNVIVIIWGAFVRASGSGAGCGDHWPLCNGEVIPRPERIETLIEFSHRISSGLALLAVVALLFWAFRVYPKGHIVRKGALWSMFFMILEALVGAALVLLQYVAFNVSVGRAIWMAGHLVNTFLLLGALTLTAWWAQGGQPLRLRGQGAVGWTLLLACLGMFVLGMSGAITALGDTLVLTGGISPTENALVATLVEMRILHPIIAFSVGALVVLAAWVAMQRRSGRATQQLGRLVIGLYVVQLLVGALNVALRAPVWLQLVHLAFTSTIWILLVMLAASALASRDEVTESAPRAALKRSAPA